MLYHLIHDNVVHNAYMEQRSHVVAICMLSKCHPITWEMVLSIITKSISPDKQAK